MSDFGSEPPDPGEIAKAYQQMSPRIGGTFDHEQARLEDMADGVPDALSPEQASTTVRRLLEIFSLVYTVLEELEKEHTKLVQTVAGQAAQIEQLAAQVAQLQKG